MRPPFTFSAVPKLVLAELLHRWVRLHAAVELSTDRTDEVVALATEPLPRGVASRAITVCKRYNVVRIKKELRLRLRNAGPGS